MSSRRVPKVRQLAEFWRPLARRLAKLRQLANFRARDGRVNVSPKGLDSLRVLGPNHVVWLNATGSGNESAAYVLDTPRMTLMFCALEDKPLILRQYGTACTIHPARRRLVPARGPLFEFQGQRTLMDSWAANKSDAGLAWRTVSAGRGGRTR